MTSQQRWYLALDNINNKVSLLYSLNSSKIRSWSLRFRQFGVCQVNTAQSSKRVHSCLVNKWAKFGIKIFAHFWDIVIFVLGHFLGSRCTSSCFTYLLTYLHKQSMYGDGKMLNMTEVTWVSECLMQLLTVDKFRRQFRTVQSLQSTSSAPTALQAISQQQRSTNTITSGQSFEHRWSEHTDWILTDSHSYQTHRKHKNSKCTLVSLILMEITQSPPC